MSPRIWLRRWRPHALPLSIVALGFVALFFVQLQNFLLFHSITEIFSILVAFAVFVVTWNAREELESSFVAVLGISYLFVGSVDLLHTLAYKGMGVFPTAGADLPTQLWLFGRYLEVTSVVAAGVVGYLDTERSALEIEWNDRTLQSLLAGYALVVAVGLSSIFVFDQFPTAYVAGSGLTRFKVVSEYLIVGLFAASLALVYRQRDAFDARVFRFFTASILLTMGSELAFTFYVDVYGFSNTVGHFLKLGSFYLVYLAVVKTGIKEPQKTLYRELTRREAEARKFKKAAEYSGHAVLITDRDGVIQYVNAAWEELTGYSSSDAIGETPRILKSGEHDESFYDDLWSTILAGDVWVGEIVNERPSGARYVVRQTAAPIYGDDGDIQHFVAILDEITEQRAYKERLESDLQKSITQLQILDRLLRHNIRNEINVILGNAEMIQRDASDEDITEMSTLIVEASDRLLTQADKQRDIVRLLLESSTVTRLDLAAVVGRLVDQFERQYPQADLAVDIPAGLELTTVPELGQAIEEIVENAIIHNDRTAPEVVISAQRRPQTQTVEIQITDDGPGIPAVEQQVILGETEIDALLHSRGMGLWLADNIVSEAGGAIQFADADPRGSVVTLVIPQTQATNRRLSPSAASDVSS